MQKSTGRPSAKLPSFARGPSTLSSFFPAEVPPNSVVDQQRLQISELHFDKYHTLSTFSCYAKREVRAIFEVMASLNE